MKFSKKLRGLVGCAWIAATVLFLVSSPAAAGQRGFAEEGGAAVSDESGEAAAGVYSSLPDLIVMVCNDAMGQFEDFFGPAPVLVEPFMVLGEFPDKKVSLLGATLADQMAAVIDDDAMAQKPPADEVYDQRLQGLLQEMDGYLRIHMSGRNSRGEWRSYVVNVEMSEPIYRALHSYVAM